MINQSISHFKILEKLGEGGMGVVYKAEDTQLERIVAVKFLPREIAAQDEVKKRFKIEAKAAAALNHPNIATIYQIEEVDDKLFIVMEYIEGRELSQIVRADGHAPLPVDDILNYATQIAEGLQAAHEKGVVHRDIKSTNIMITNKGQIKIMDFGLAKLADQTQLTQDGTTVGTIAYMSPEQAQGAAIDQRTDIWAFGVVLYEMLSGQLPFQGDYELAIIYSIMNEDPEPIPDLQGGVSEALQQVVAKALAKEPKDRYQQMEEVLAELNALRGVKRMPTILPSKRHTVGREKELAELQAGAQNVFAGRGLLLCVAGEPGIGKTTLVEAFLDETTIAGRPCTIARGRCSERLSGTEAYLPFLEVLESLLKSQADGSVTKMMRETAPWWYAQVASLSADDPDDARLLQEVRNATQERAKRELARFLEEASRQQTLVFFFDDLHWSDVSTVDLLAYLANHFEAMRLLIVGTYRPEELLLAEHPFVQVRRDLQGRGVCREIALGFLSRDEIERYLELHCPEHDFPADFPKLIHERTEGSPLFMADLVRYLKDHEVIIEEEGRWTLSQAVADIQLELPESVRGMIERKIDRLSEEDRGLLAAASVQGYEFDTAVVGQVLELDEEEIEERLQVLDRDHGFVQFVEEQEFPDRTLTLRYRFVHVLYQNELYASLTRTKQTRLSKSAAEALLDYYGEQSSSVASELAVLFETARDFPRAVQYFSSAAQNASKVFAYHEAIVLARRGLDLLKTLPDTPEKTQQELVLQLALGVSLMSTKGFTGPGVLEAYTRARELCQQVGATPQLFPVLYGLFGFYFIRAELQTAREITEQFVHLAQQQQASDPLVVAHRVLGTVVFMLGELSSARVHIEKAIVSYDPEKHRSHVFLYGRDTGVDSLIISAFVLWSLGYPDQAKQRSHEGLSLAQELNHPHTLAIALNIATYILQFCREERLTQERAEAAITLSTEQGFPLWMAWGTIMRGWALSCQGQEDDGIEQIRQGLDAYRATGAQLFCPYFLSLLAEGYMKAGQAEEGLNVVDEALAAVSNTGERWCETELHRLKGELLLMQGEAESEVEGCFCQALEVARRQEAKSLELRTAMSLGRLWQKQGKQKEARELLSEIYGWFTEGFDTKDLQEAKALLEELS